MWIQFFFLCKALHKRKNWLFFGDANAGERSAVIYSIIESCSRHDVEPYAYLQDFLTRLPSMTNRQIKDIVPKAWTAAHKATPTVLNAA
jgi:transposase